MKQVSDDDNQFSIETPFINNYVNGIWVDVQNYQYWTSKRYDVGVQGYGASLNRTLLALRRLLTDMPRKGMAYIQAQVDQHLPELKEVNDVLDLWSYKHADTIFQFAMDWLQPNLFELHINVGKPAYSSQGHLGNKPR